MKKSARAADSPCVELKAAQLPSLPLRSSRLVLSPCSDNKLTLTCVSCDSHKPVSSGTSTHCSLFCPLVTTEHILSFPRTAIQILKGNQDYPVSYEYSQAQ